VVNVSDDACVSYNGWVVHQFNNFFSLPVTRHNYSNSFSVIFVVLKAIFLIFDGISDSLEMESYMEIEFVAY